MRRAMKPPMRILLASRLSLRAQESVEGRWPQSTRNLLALVHSLMALYTQTKATKGNPLSLRNLVWFALQMALFIAERCNYHLPKSYYAPVINESDDS